ncbi:MAG: glycosyltransferase family 2 protein, partial [Patescibacteria group bacterium]
MAARVGVVVVHYKNWDVTRRCVASVQASTYKNFGTQVVDNDKINRGFAGGANVGIRAVLQDSAVDYVLVLNNDAQLEPPALTEMMKTPQETGAGMVAPVVRRVSNNAIESMGLRINSARLGFNRRSASDGQLLCPTGAAALYSRKLIEDVSRDGKFFDEDFFMYGEDTDVGLQARALGYQCVLAEKAVVFHEGSASASNTSAPMYLGHRNNVWYIAKNISKKYWYQWPAIVAGQ